MNYTQTTDYLFSRHAGGMKLGLDNILALLNRLDHPEYSFPAVHIAGTNGKGSTAAITESILRHAGYKTGLYTSPHLVDMCERIQVCGRQISQDEVVNYTKAIKPFADEVNATFFEILTAMAYCYFQDKRIDIAVIETGLGGRLDATKTANSIISIITNIDLEHTNILGDTLEKIAFEKAGILHPNVPCILGSDNLSVQQFFREYCKNHQVPLYIVKDNIDLIVLKSDLTGNEFTLKTSKQIYPNLQMSLPALHQIDNAVTSLITIEQLQDQGYNISENALRNGLKMARWDGRLQVLQNHPLILVDSAHNLMGIQSLTQMLKIYLGNKRIILIFGLLKDKNYTAMAETIVPIADEIMLTEPKNDRALSVDILSKLTCFNNKTLYINPDIEKAFNQTLSRIKMDDCLCVTGSLYLIGEVLRLWKRYQILHK